MKILRITVVLAVMSISSLAQEKSYSREQLQGDLKLARAALEESHPSMYRFVNKTELDKQFDKAHLAIHETMTESEFYKLLAPPVLAIGCGHTTVRSDSTFSRLLKRRLPFDIRIIGQRNVFVSKTFSADIIAGAEIISIDGTPILDIVTSFLPYISRDGFITTGRIKSIERNFSVRLQLHFSSSASYVIVFKDKNGNRATKKVSLVPATQIAREKERPGLEYRVVNNTGILTIRSFEGSVKDATGRGFKDFLAATFASINQSQIQSLIIDVRGNGGGQDEYGALLFTYLTDKPFEYYSYLEINNPTLSFLKYTDQSSAFRDQMVRLSVQKNGRYFLTESSHRALPVQQPQAKHFDKSVFVLIDGGSFSATTEFAAVARFKKRAFFIGEETGGAYEGNTSGYGVLLTLPNTGIGVRIPLLKYACAVEPDPQPRGRGIIPDLEVAPTIQGIIAGRDEVLEQATAKAWNWSNGPRK